jgi:CheY-like chemotaxis protein
MAVTGPVLLVEDDANDAILIQRSLKQAGLRNRLVVLSDGHQAVNYLSGHGPYRDRTQYPLPVLILLDLGLPKVSGFEFLQWLRNEPEFTGLPVVVLTGSAFSPDVKRAYALGANSFLVKPTDSAELAVMLKSTTEYWLGTCQLPTTRERQPVENLPGADSQQLETNTG